MLFKIDVNVGERSGGGGGNPNRNGVGGRGDVEMGEIDVMFS